MTAKPEFHWLKGVMIAVMALSALAFLSYGLVRAFIWILPDEEDFRDMSLQAEEMLSRAIERSFLATALDRPDLDEALAPVYLRLTNEIDDLPFPARFHLVANEEVNAYAYPGGHIVIHTGLLKAVTTPEQLAAVLAHELAHVKNRDSMKSLLNQVGVAMIIATISGGDPNAVHELLALLGKTSYSRKVESEADAYAFNLLVKAKISPQALADFFKRLQKVHGGAEAIPELLSTHPNLENRIQTIEAKLVDFEFKPEPFDMDWLFFQEKL